MNNKKKVLIFTDCFIFGGCEIVLVNLVNSKLLKKDFDFLYSYRSFADYDREVENKVIDKKLLIPLKLFSNDSFFYKLKLRKVAWYEQIIKYFLFFISKSGFYSVFNFIQLSLFFKKENPDILFINNGGYPGSVICRLAVFAAKFVKIPKVIFNVNNLAYNQISLLEKKTDSFINKNVDAFVTASFSAKNRLSLARFFEINKISTLSNAVKEVKIPHKESILRNEFNLNPSTIVIGSVGLLTKRKGFSVLIESINIILERNKNLNFQLFIIGEGEDRNKLESMIDEFGLNDFIHLIGFRNNVLNYVNDFDLFILPSISNEDMPYVIIEAMMLKKPVIATNVAGIPEEVIDGKTGLVVTPGSKNELAIAIEHLLSNDEIRLSYGENGYNRFNVNFRYEVIMEKYKELFYTVYEQ